MRVLVTGFGPFPGVPVNATMRLVPELAAQAGRLFPDAQIVSGILPTEWQAAPRHVQALVAEVQPDLVLHFGVSSRARGFEVEQRGANACVMQPDACGVLPSSIRVREGGPEFLPAGIPVPYVVARLRRRGIRAFVSRDAGGYLCNATLYASLDAARAVPGRRIGFIHIPASLARPGAANRGRSGASPLTWTQAVEGGLEILAACLHRPGLARAATLRRIA